MRRAPFGPTLLAVAFNEKQKAAMIVIQNPLNAPVAGALPRGALGKMEARLLEYFLRVAELGSINRAAAELNMSQPSLSRWLALLEHETGTPLLIRGRQGVRPTDAGQLLIDRSRPILRQFQLLCEEVGQKASAQVALGMPFSMRRMVTAPFAEQVAREQPHITLRVYEGINNSIRRWMQEGLLDVAVMACLEHAPESFTTVPILTEKLLLVGDTKAALRLDAQVALSRLGIAHLIQPGRPNVIRALVENTLHRHGYEYHNRFEAETLSLCLELARRGLGYTVMPYCALHGQLEEGSALSAAPIDKLSVTWALHVNRAREHAVVVRSLASALRNFISDLLKSGEWRFGEMVRTSESRRQVKVAESH